MKACESLIELGFGGFMPVRDLRASGLAEVPRVPGVYALVRSSDDLPVFESVSAGGHFKGKDPTVPVVELLGEWVHGSRIVYIGKAGGPGGRATLRSRLKQYLDFGAGRPIGHWGGRLVWQLRDAEDLLVGWLATANRSPVDVECNLIAAFRAEHGRLPFANLKAGTRR